MFLEKRGAANAELEAQQEGCPKAELAFFCEFCAYEGDYATILFGELQIWWVIGREGTWLATVRARGLHNRAVETYFVRGGVERGSRSGGFRRPSSSMFAPSIDPSVPALRKLLAGRSR